MEFAAIFQMPTIGADVCGFNFETWETLCTRWAVLGAWYPFYRNHADISAPFQEFYRWPAVADAARSAIKTRYQLLDYFYTEFHYQTVDGTPSTILPIFYLFPHDRTALDIELQFFYGTALLVSPVTDDESTKVTFYLPAGIWYDFWTGEKISIGAASIDSDSQNQESAGGHKGEGKWITRENVGFDEIPVHMRAGTIIPMRINGANTTTQLRKIDFELIVAPDEYGKATGRLWLDDGESIVHKRTSSKTQGTVAGVLGTGEEEATSEVLFDYDAATGKLRVHGRFGYDSSVKIVRVTVLGDERSSNNEAIGRQGQSLLGDVERGSGMKHGRTTVLNQGLNEGFGIYVS